MKLKSGLGIWQILPSEIITDIIAQSGIDLTIFDLEHGLHNSQSVQRCVFAAKSNSLLSIARIPSIDYSEIIKLIDSGIDGILFPHVENITQLDLLRKNSLLNPLGNRSFSPFVPRFSYGASNKSSFYNPSIGILIESLNGVHSADLLLNNTFVDFVYFGAYDLSVEMSCSGEIFAISVVEQLKKLVAIARRYKKVVLAIYRTQEELKLLYEIGVDYPIAGVDTGQLYNVLTSEINNYTNIFNSDR